MFGCSLPIASVLTDISAFFKQLWNETIKREDFSVFNDMEAFIEGLLAWLFLFWTNLLRCALILAWWVIHSTSRNINANFVLDADGNYYAYAFSSETASGLQTQLDFGGIDPFMQLMYPDQPNRRLRVRSRRLVDDNVVVQDPLLMISFKNIAMFSISYTAYWKS